MKRNHQEVYKTIEKALEAGEIKVLAIDGPCASGKSTLAGLLQERFGARLIPMDDFFLPVELRTPDRYALPGGNIHQERFLEEVAPFLGAAGLKAPLKYRPFDCKRMEYGPCRTVPWAPLTIVEGSYSFHEALRHLYDISVFLTVEPEEQERRILSREGPEGLQIFKSRWIPLENKYFETLHPERFCDFIL
jgi:hypothetical protein